MRREQVLKVCANHRITSQMELKEHNGKENAYIWSAVDYSDGTAKHDTLCVRFKTDDQAKRFVKIFNEAKSINGKQTVDFLSIDKMRLSDEDVTIISEVKPTKEQIDRAKHLQLPSTFYLYENKEPCEGCRGCKEDSPSILSNEVQFEDQLTPYQTAALLEQLRNLPSGFFPNSSLPTLMSLVPTWFPESLDSFPTLNMPSPPRDRRMIIKAKRSLPSNRAPPPPPTTSSSPHSIHEQISSGIEEVAVVQTHQKKSRNFSGNIMQSYSLDNFASQLTKNIIEQVKQELVQQSEIVTTKEDTTLKSHSNNNNPSIFTDSSSSILENLVPVKSVSAGFSFANFDLSTKASTNTFQFSSSNPSTTTNTTPLFTFGNVPKVSFAQIAQQSSNNQWTSQDSDQRVFSGERTLLFDTQAKEDQDDDNDNDAYESYEPSVTYKPIVHLSPVETRTGEEDEDILFCERAKLYRFDMLTNEMKERGIGELKILQHKQTHLCRVLMRREQVLKVCANHRITSQMELKEHNGKENAYIWSAVDYSDGTAKHETLCVRFKTDDQAKRFVKTFNEAKSINGKQTVDFLSIDKMRLSDEDVTIISEVKPTKEQIDRAKHLQLPSTFYLYENKEPCEGCRGCKEDSPSILSNEVQFEDQLTPYQTAALLEQLRNLPSGFFPNSSLPTLMSLVPTWFPESLDSFPTLNMPSPPRDRRMIIKAKRSLPSNRAPPPPPTTSSSPHSIHEQISSGIEEVAVVQTHQKKSRNFSGNIMQSYSLDNFASQLTKNIIEQVKQELVQQSEIVTTKEDTTLKSHSNNNNPSIFTDSSSSTLENLVPVKSVTAGFSFANFDLSTKASTNTFHFSSSNPSTTTNTTPLFTFGNVPKVSFAQIAQQSSNNQWTSQDSDQRVFSGERTLLFDTQTKEDQDDDNDNDAYESYEPSVTYKPIVHLSPVETRTGEEDEDILFCERAKLYRFDMSTNEMKERGIGEMKILQHKQTHLCRVLMRREQVLKVCANHRITSQMELKEHNGKENAYIWSAVDYSDGTAKRETLCVKFKKTDQAKQFYKQFNDAKQINATNQQ